MNYHQCVLQKQSKSGILQTITYLPEKYASVGCCIKLKYGEDWIDGWFVHYVGPPVSEKYVQEHQMDYKRQRKASDI